MKNGKTVGLLLALAFASIFATDGAAQSSHQGQAAASGQPKASALEGAGRQVPDMRLWSFGDCDNKFPYVDSDEHKECVRVVGSEEARDARAYRICETSNPGDAAEVARCKSTYTANKDKSARSGYVPNVAAAQEQAQPTAEDLQRVRAIASAAVERESVVATPVAAPVAAAEVSNPPPTPEPEEKSGSSTLVIALFVAALLGGGAYAAKRKQSGTSPAR